MPTIYEEIFEAVVNNDYLKLRNILESNLYSSYKINLNYRYKEGTNLLFWAAYCNHPNILSLLLSYPISYPINVNQRDFIGTTALYQAADMGREKIVQVLLNKCLDDILVDLATDIGNTPLHIASYNGHSDIVRELLKFGASPYIRNNDKKTAIDLAIIQNRYYIKHLLDNTTLTPVTTAYKTIPIKTSFVSHYKFTPLTTTSTEYKPTPIPVTISSHKATVPVVSSVTKTIPVTIATTLKTSSVSDNLDILPVFKIYLDNDKYYPIENRIEKIKNTLEYIENKLVEKGITKVPSTECVKAILIAPEYFLSRSSTGKIIKKEDKYKIETEIAELSRKHKNILIAPGTFSWAKPGNIDVNHINPTTDKEKINELYLAYKNNKISRGIHNFKTSDEFINSRFNLTRSLKTEKYLNELDSNNYNLNHKLDNNIFHNRVKEFDAEKIKKSYIIINVNKVYLNGSEIFKQHKYANFHEEDNLKDQIFLPGQAKSDIKMSGLPLLSVKLRNGKTIKIGFEICFDHYNAVGKKYWKETPDLHIIFSDCVENKEANFKVKSNGFIVHASTSSIYDSIYQNNAIKFCKLPENTDSKYINYKTINIKFSDLKFA